MSADPLTPRERLLVEAVAERAAQLVLEALEGTRGTPAQSVLLSAQQLAERLGASPDYVYAHCRARAVRLGEGKRAPLRSHQTAVLRLASKRSQTPDPSESGISEPPRRRRKARVPNQVHQPGQSCRAARSRRRGRSAHPGPARDRARVPDASMPPSATAGVEGSRAPDVSAVPCSSAGAVARGRTFPATPPAR